MNAWIVETLASSALLMAFQAIAAAHGASAARRIVIIRASMEDARANMIEACRKQGHPVAAGERDWNALALCGHTDFRPDIRVALLNARAEIARNRELSQEQMARAGRNRSRHRADGGRSARLTAWRPSNKGFPVPHRAMPEQKPPEQQPGLAQQLHPLIRRVLAPNPSPYTYSGTQTYLVGRGEVAVIDPGPDLPEHVAAILAATQGETIAAIVCTHTHRDHSPASRPLKAATGAPIIGCAPLDLADDGPRSDAAFDEEYYPDRVLADGQTIAGPGWTLEAVATPGHTSNHLCLALPEAGALFTGDHVMGWSTSVISPPDGDMSAYLKSLEKLMRRSDRIYYPAHGEGVEDPQRFARSLLGHRRSREGQIKRLLDEAPRTIPQMVERMYVGLDPRLIGAAGRSVLAHLVDMEARELVWQEGESWMAIA